MLSRSITTTNNLLNNILRIMDRTTLILLLSVIPTAVLLGFTLLYIPPSSPVRILMLPVILSATAVTSAAAIRTNGTWAMHSFLGIEYGPFLALQAVDMLFLSRVYYQDDLRDVASTSKNCSTNQSAVASASTFM